MDHDVNSGDSSGFGRGEYGRSSASPGPGAASGSNPLNGRHQQQQEHHEDEDDDLFNRYIDPSALDGQNNNNASNDNNNNDLFSGIPGGSAATADDDESEEVCRVCRSEGEPDNPLYHPCKCSGSIRYVHSDCLVQWLGHSRNKKCELCGHAFSFKKIYPSDMPSSLPIRTLIFKFLFDLLSSFLILTRAILVAFAWLIFLPLIAYGMWRGLFAGGNSLAWWIMDRDNGIVAVASNVTGKGLLSAGKGLFNGSIAAAVAEGGDGNTTGVALGNATADLLNAVSKNGSKSPTELDKIPGNLFEMALRLPKLIREARQVGVTPWMVMQQMWENSNLPETVFRGQVLTICVVLTFLAVFLLREWIFQNGVGEGQANNVEVPLQGPEPNVAEWAPHMAVRWRRRRAEGRDREGGQEGGHAGGRRRRDRRRGGGGGGAGAGVEAGELGQLLALPRLEQERFEDREARLRQGQRMIDEDWRVLAQAQRDNNELPQGENQPGHLDRELDMEMEPAAQRDADDWESINDSPSSNDRRLEDIAAEHEHEHEADFERFATPAILRAQAETEDKEARAGSQQPIDDDDDDDEVLAHNPDPIAMREARNRYFAVRDHNHEFGSQAELNPIAGPSGSSSRHDIPKIVEPESTQGKEEDESKPVPPRTPRRSARLNPGLANPDVATGEDKARSTSPQPDHAHLAAVSEDAEDEWEDEPAPAQPFLGAPIAGAGRLGPLGLQDPFLLPFPPRPEGNQPWLPQLDPANFEAQQAGERALRERQEQLLRRVERNEDLRRNVERDVDELRDMQGRGEFDDEDVEGGFIVEGDLDGILEAIGMRGPIFALLQNVFLIVFVLGTTLTLLIQLPYIVGKMYIMADWRFVVNIITLPIHLVRFITDPVVDIAIDLGSIIILKPLRSTIPLVDRYLAGIAAKKAAIASSPGPSKFGGLMTGHTVEWLRQAPTRVLSTVIPQGIKPENPTTLQTVLYGLEDGFAALGAASVFVWNGLQTQLDAIGSEDTAWHRAIVIGIGYLNIVTVLLIIAALGEKRLGTTGKFVAQAVTQYGTIVKLGFFMAIELFVFPLVMGFFLDFFSLPLFVEGTLTGRLKAQQAYPILSIFAHWLGGTLFMFSFAKFLSTCRSICRRGAMYIIRDPQDPSFSPVRDILDKKTAVQLYKLLVSATMYLSVLSGPIGGLLYAIRYSNLTENVLPLRLHLKHPISTNPVDIAMLLFIIPKDLRRNFPIENLRRGLKIWWKALARTLRLTSYFDGVRHEEEENAGRVERFLLSAFGKASTMWEKVFKRKMPKSDLQAGGLMRVPYADQVVLIRPRRNVFIPVDSSGVPIDDEGKVMSVMQSAVAVKARRNPRQDYCMVYLPPLYRIRFWIFAIALWTGVAWASLGAALSLLVLGRWGMSRIVNGPVHDGYSLLLGALIASKIWYLTVEVIYRQHRKLRRQGITTLKALAKGWLAHLLNRTRKLPSVLFMAALPVGLLLDLYILFPLKYGFSTMTPVFYVQEAWTTGLAVIALCMYRRRVKAAIYNLIGANTIAGIDAMPEDLVAAHQRKIWLAVATLPAVFLGPGFLASVVCFLFRLSSKQSAIIFRWSYPTVLILAVTYHFVTSLVRRFRAWSNSKLENHYLVEQRVMNIDEAKHEGEDIKILDPTLHIHPERDQQWEGLPAL